MKIRKATKKDMKEVIKLMMTEFNRPPWSEKWTKDNAGKTTKSLGGIIYVATENKTIIGFILVTGGHYNKGPIIEICEFAVSKKFQKKGIGELLINHIENLYKKKNFSAIHLATLRKSGAYKFYKKRGYKNYREINMIKKLK